jgi:hypothetical protein
MSLMAGASVSETAIGALKAAVSTLLIPVRFVVNLFPPRAASCHTRRAKPLPPVYGTNLGTPTRESTLSGPHLSKRSSGSRRLRLPRKCAAPGAKRRRGCGSARASARQVGAHPSSPDSVPPPSLSAPDDTLDGTVVAMSDDRIARVARDRRGTHAGHIDRRTRRSEAHTASDLGFSWWGGQDLNLRPTDYESAALTD